MKNKSNKITITFLISIVFVLSLLPVFFYDKTVVTEGGPSSILHRTNMIGLVVKGIINGDLFIKISSYVCCFLFYAVLISSLILTLLNKARVCKTLIPILFLFYTHLIFIFWTHNEICFVFSLAALFFALVLTFLCGKQEKVTFSDKLKNLRKSRNLSQQELANQVYISRSMIAKYETNAALPSPNDIRSFSDFFGVQPNHLMETPKEISIPYKSFNAFITLHNIVFVLTSILCVVFVVIATIPVFGGRSLIDGSIANNSLAVQISIVVSLLTLLINTVLKMCFKSIKSKIISSICLDIGFIINVILIVFSFVVGLGGLSI